MGKFKVVAIGLIAASFLSSAGFAADLPPRKDAPVYVAPVPAFVWTGFYVGGDIGVNVVSTPVTSDWNGLGARRLETSGVMGGGYVGYNYQFNLAHQDFVVGVEGDFQGTSAEKSYSWIGSNLVRDRNVYTAKAQTNWLAAINGRVGIAIDRALFYAIGGAAWAQSSASLAGAAPSGLFVGSVSTDKTLSGWDLGAGMEYAFTPNWVGRIEYRNYEFGKYNVTPFAPNLTPLHEQTSNNTVRVGLAYLFSAPLPVVAKY